MSLRHFIQQDFLLLKDIWMKKGSEKLQQLNKMSISMLVLVVYPSIWIACTWDAFYKGSNKRRPTDFDRINIKQSYSYWGKEGATVSE